MWGFALWVRGVEEFGLNGHLGVVLVSSYKFAQNASSTNRIDLDETWGKGSLTGSSFGVFGIFEWDAPHHTKIIFMGNLCNVSSQVCCDGFP